MKLILLLAFTLISVVSRADDSPRLSDLVRKSPAALEPMRSAYQKFIEREFPWGPYCADLGDSNDSDQLHFEGCLDVAKNEIRTLREGSWLSEFEFRYYDQEDPSRPVFLKRHRMFAHDDICDINIALKIKGGQIADYTYDVYCD